MEVKIVGGVPYPGTTGTPGVEQIIDGTFGASRVSLRPLDYQTGGQILGHYRVASLTGLTTSIAAGGAIFSFRFAPGTSNFAVVERVSVAAVITTAFTAGQPVDADVVIVRAFTASDSGGTALAPLGSSNKVRTSMGNSLASDVRIATTAALGAGTGAADAAAFGIGVASQTNAVGTGGGVNGSGDLYSLNMNAAHPIVLQNNEGFRVRVVTAQGSTGVVKYYIAAEWAEVVGY